MIDVLHYNYSNAQNNRWFTGEGVTIANQIKNFTTDGSKSVFDLLTLVRKFNFKSSSANSITFGYKAGAYDGLLRLIQVGSDTPSSVTPSGAVLQALVDIIDLLYDGKIFYINKDMNIVTPDGDLTNVTGLVYLYSKFTPAAKPTTISFLYDGNPNSNANWHYSGTVSLDPASPQIIYVNASAGSISAALLDPAQLEFVVVPLSEFITGMINEEITPAIATIKTEISKKFVSR